MSTDEQGPLSEENLELAGVMLTKGEVVNPLFVATLIHEVRRLRSAVEASWDVCSRSGGCIPGRPW